MSRKYARQSLLESAEFKVAAVEAKELLFGYDFALIGGLAVGYYCNPPVTIDIDFIVDGNMAQMESISETFKDAGWTSHHLAFVSQIRGDFRYGIQIKKKRSGARVDLLMTGNGKYLRSVVRRAVPVVLGGIKMNIATPEDIVVLKTSAGRDKDTSDCLALEQALDLDWKYIYKTLEKYF